MAEIKITATLRSNTAEMKLALASEIYDEALGMFQSQLNQRIGSGSGGGLTDEQAALLAKIPEVEEKASRALNTALQTKEEQKAYWNSVPPFAGEVSGVKVEAAGIPANKSLLGVYWHAGQKEFVGGAGVSFPGMPPAVTEYYSSWAATEEYPAAFVYQATANRLFRKGTELFAVVGGALASVGGGTGGGTGIIIE